MIPGLRAAQGSVEQTIRSEDPRAGRINSVHVRTLGKARKLPFINGARVPQRPP